MGGKSHGWSSHPGFGAATPPSPWALVDREGVAVITEGWLGSSDLRSSTIVDLKQS